MKSLQTNLRDQSKEEIINNLFKKNLIHKDDYDKQIEFLSDQLTIEEIEKSIEMMKKNEKD